MKSGLLFYSVTKPAIEIFKVCLWKAEKGQSGNTTEMKEKHW